MAHAPGPWWVRRDRHNVYVRNERGLIAQGVFPTHYTNQDERFVLERGEYEANARLIAACPDLLEALRAITKNYADFVDSGDAMGNSVNHTDIPEIVAALAAIAKATGDTP